MEYPFSIEQIVQIVVFNATQQVGKSMEVMKKREMTPLVLSDTQNTISMSDCIYSKSE